MPRSMLRPMPAQMPTSLQCELRNARSLVSAPASVNNGPCPAAVQETPERLHFARQVSGLHVLSSR
jgi:hypothetical protein